MYSILPSWRPDVVSHTLSLIFPDAVVTVAAEVSSAVDTSGRSDHC